MVEHLWIVYLLSTAHSFNVTFKPEKIEPFRTYETRSVLVQVNSSESEKINISAVCKDIWYCKVVDYPTEVGIDENQTAEFNISIRANFLGLSEMSLQIDGENFTYPLKILRSERGHITANIFTIIVIIFIVFVTFMMGTQLKLKQIGHILKKPVGPVIGFLCQYGLMPLIGFFVSYYGLASFDRSVQLALFAVATCPGGGKSSVWTILFGGNLDLSISMTAFQTLAALFMMPIWLHLGLGRFFMDGDRISIPFINIVKSLMGIAIPTIIGMAFTHYRPQYVQLIQKWITRVSWASMVTLTIFAIYTNFYMIYLVNLRLFVCACALPWLGYIFAFILARLLGQDFKNCLTIAIETGIQNVGIAMVLISICLPEPESDISVTVVFIMAIMTDKPLLLIWFCIRLHKKFYKNKKHCCVSRQIADDEEEGMELQEKIEQNEDSVVSA